MPQISQPNPTTFKYQLAKSFPDMEQAQLEDATRTTTF
jgi:hypothetical protein